MNARHVSLTLALSLFMAAAALANDAEKIRYKRTKGEKSFHQTKAETKQSQTVMGMTFETKVEVDSISSSTVDDVDAEGNYRIIEKAERIKVKADFGPAGEYAFDSQSSERDKASELGGLITPIFERLSTASLQVVLTPQGEVKEVKGYTDLFRDLIESNPLASQFTGGGTDETAKIAMQDRLPKFPDKPLSVGDTWETPTNYEIPKIGKITGKKTYRYVGPDKVGDRPTAKFEVTGDSTIEVNLDQMGVVVTGTFKSMGSSETIQFDVEAGQILSFESTHVLGGDLNVNANGTNIPVHQQQTQKQVVKWLPKLPD